MLQPQPQSPEVSWSDLTAPRPEHIAEFKRLYWEHFGVSLGDDNAKEGLERLLVIVRYRRHLFGLQQD